MTPTMTRPLWLKRAALAWVLMTVAACSGSIGLPQPYVPAVDGWLPEAISVRPVGLGLGGGNLAPGIIYAGGIEIVAAAGSPLHSLSDLKRFGPTAFVSVSDVGDLVTGELRLDAGGRLVGIDAARSRRLALADGSPIVDKAEGDSEGLAILPDGDLLVSFERDHRIWNYGRLPALHAPTPMRKPDTVFPENDGMEGLTATSTGWRVNGESGGVWDCTPAACTVVTPLPPTPIPDSDYRITSMDRDPSSAGGWFVLQRSYAPPIDARARIRHMDQQGNLGPVLVELRLPGTTDNFEGLSAETRNGKTRLYILSDDNFNPLQRTLMLAFDVAR
ncbi:esterase-like activity of phytase family protein [soil metagenome]